MSPIYEIFVNQMLQLTTLVIVIAIKIILHIELIVFFDKFRKVPLNKIEVFKFLNLNVVEAVHKIIHAYTIDPI